MSVCVDCRLDYLIDHAVMSQILFRRIHNVLGVSPVSSEVSDAQGEIRKALERFQDKWGYGRRICTHRPEESNERLDAFVPSDEPEDFALLRPVSNVGIDSTPSHTSIIGDGRGVERGGAGKSPARRR